MHDHGRAAVEALAQAEHVVALHGRELHGDLHVLVEEVACLVRARDGARDRGGGHVEDVVVLRERMARDGRVREGVRLLVVQVGRLVGVAVRIVGRKRKADVCERRAAKISAKRGVESWCKVWVCKWTSGKSPLSSIGRNAAQKDAAFCIVSSARLDR